MKRDQKFDRAAKVATCSALALILSSAPIVVDLAKGTVRVAHVYADSSCFIKGTKVRMADGSRKNIEDVRPGDRVLGIGGRANLVTGVERRRLGRRRLYRLNEGAHFVTAEHPFFTPSGWKSIEPRMTAVENPKLAVSPLCVGDRIGAWAGSRTGGGLVRGDLALAAGSAPLLEWIALATIEATEADPETALYNLLLSNDHTYFANDYLVHNKGGEGGEGGGGSGGGEGGEGGDDGGGSGGGGEGGEGGDDGGGSGGGEGGERGEDHDSKSQVYGLNDDDDDRGRRRGRGRHSDAMRNVANATDDLSPVGPDLTPEEESRAIANGWQR